MCRLQSELFLIESHDVTGCFRSFAIHPIQPPHFGVEENEAEGGIKPAGPGEPSRVSCPEALIPDQRCHSEPPQLLLVCGLIKLHVLLWERPDQISAAVGNRILWLCQVAAGSSVNSLAIIFQRN